MKNLSIDIETFSSADLAKSGVYKYAEAVELCCAIGDDTVGGVPYAKIVETARNFIRDIGGFEKFAEWGLV